MSTFTLNHSIPATPRVSLHSLRQALRGRLAALQPVPTQIVAGPLGQSEAEIYARGMLGWRG